MESFSELINPIDKKTFWRDYYENKPLIIERANAQYYDDILNINQIDSYLAKHDIEYPSIRLVKDGDEIEGHKYLKDINYGTSMFEGLIQTDKMFQLFSEGATIIIQGLDRSNKSLGTFCRKLSNEVPFIFQSNIYITPQSSKGFTSHYDTHDVFVLQIKGSKKWRLFDPSPVNLPTKNENFKSDETDLSNLELTHEFNLTEGDLLYIPRGVVHNAKAADKNSIHITLGVFPEKWYDLFRFIGQESYLFDQLKKTLPINHESGKYDFEEIKGKIKDQIDLLFDENKMNLILEKFADENIKKQRGSDYSRFKDLLKLESINEETILTVRKNIVFDLNEHEDKYEVRFYNKSIKLPLHTLSTIKIILSGEPFSCKNLDSNLDIKSRLILVKKLIKEGLIRIK